LWRNGIDTVFLVRKTGGKRELGKPGSRWENNTKIDLRGYGMDSSGSGQRQVADTCDSGNEPSVP
jgi:hypothetical protein